MSLKEEKERKSVLQEREWVVERRHVSGVLLSPAQPPVLAKPQGVSDEHQSWMLLLGLAHGSVTL